MTTAPDADSVTAARAADSVTTPPPGEEVPTALAADAVPVTTDLEPDPGTATSTAASDTDHAPPAAPDFVAPAPPATSEPSSPRSVPDQPRSRRVKTPKSAADYRARKLGPWSVTWRYAVSITGWALAIIFTATTKDFWLWALDAGLGLVASLVLIRFRRRWPFIITLSLSLVSIVAPSAGYFATWSLVSLATHRRWRQTVIAAASYFVTGLISTFLFSDMESCMLIGDELICTQQEPLAYIISLGTGALMLVAMCMWGAYLGARAELLASLQERAETAEREQDLRITQAQLAERNRIAREMHDVVAHRISLVSMHAGVLAYREDLDRRQTREIAQVIQENAHASLTELRAVLGSLRQDMPELPQSPDKPQPTIADLDALIEESRAAGLRLDLVTDLDDAYAVPTVTGRHAYRIVQEILTNARKHAAHALVRLSITGGPGWGITIDTANGTRGIPTAVPGTGNGLVGITERAELTGGWAKRETTVEGDFHLTVWLPW